MTNQGQIRLGMKETEREKTGDDAGENNAQNKKHPTNPAPELAKPRELSKNVNHMRSGITNVSNNSENEQK